MIHLFFEHVFCCNNCKYAEFFWAGVFPVNTVLWTYIYIYNKMKMRNPKKKAVLHRYNNQLQRPIPVSSGLGTFHFTFSILKSTVKAKHSTTTIKFRIWIMSSGSSNSIWQPNRFVSKHLWWCIKIQFLLSLVSLPKNQGSDWNPVRLDSSRIGIRSDWNTVQIGIRSDWFPFRNESDQIGFP